MGHDRSRGHTLVARSGGGGGEEIKYSFRKCWLDSNQAFPDATDAKYKQTRLKHYVTITDSTQFML